MILSIDVGGTSTRIGISQDGLSFINQEKYDTPREFSEVIDLIKSKVEKTGEIEKISFGTAGVVDHNKGIIKWLPHRQHWAGAEVFTSLAEIFPKSQMKIENDANLAGLGEAVSGAGKNYSIVAYLTLSTGIGGGLVVDKKLVPSKSGFEPGHMIIKENGEEWTCGQRGCFESFASGTAFQKRFGMKAEECSDTVIWKEYAGLLAPGINNIIAVWSPEIVVLGGGVSKKTESFLEYLKEELEQYVKFGDIPEITKATLDEPGLYGGLALFNS